MAKKVYHAAAVLTKNQNQNQNQILIGGFPAVEWNFKAAPPPLEGFPNIVTPLNFEEKQLRASD